MDREENIVLTEAVYYILLSLHSPLHGYGIMQKVAEMSKGRVVLAAGTLYGAISALLEKYWIVAISGDENSRKKEYIITNEGRNAVRHEIERFRELLANGELIVGSQIAGKHIAEKHIAEGKTVGNGVRND